MLDTVAQFILAGLMSLWYIMGWGVLALPAAVDVADGGNCPLT